MNIFERIRASEKIRMTLLGDSQASAFQTFSTLQSHTKRWRSLQSRVTGGGLLATILTVGSLTLLVKVVAAGKETFVARQLGVGDALDAFLIAYSLPTLANNIIAGAFNSALIPTYVQVREREGRPAVQRLFSGVMFWVLSLLLFVSALIALLFPVVLPMLASSFNPEKLAFTRELFWGLLPIIVVTGMATTWTAVLNAEGDFALPAVTPILTSLIIIVTLFFGVQRFGVWGLVIGTLVGASVEAAFLGGCLRRHGIFLRPRRLAMDADLRQVISQYAPLAAAALVFSGITLADQAVAARLGSGSVAALNYGNKIISLFIGVTATAVSTSVLPHFSRLVALEDWKGLSRDLKSFSVLILVTLIPVALLLAFYSVPLVRLVFERGAFTPQDTRLVGYVQACFALQIPFFTVGILCFRIICALKIISRNFLIASFNVILNFVLDIVFAKHFGVAGIALSTTVVSVVSAGIYYVVVLRAIPDMAATMSPFDAGGAQ